MISVIVPVYQAVKTLDRCVESILRQEGGDLELILVDDGSTDGSGPLCDSYEDPRVKVLHRENGGAAAARNAGIEAAGGDWLCFADSDDVTAPNFLASLKKAADSTDADIAVCAHARCPEDKAGDVGALFTGKGRGRLSVYQGHEGVRALLYQKGFISAPWGMITKAGLWEGISFPEGSAAEDMATIYRLFLKASCIVRTDEVLYGYVVSAGNTIYSTSARRNPDYYRHSRQMLAYMRKAHPDCVKAAASRHLSTCFQILSEIPPATDDKGLRELASKACADIRSVRSVVIKDKNARLRNRIAALLSVFSLKAMHSFLHGRYIKSIPSGMQDTVAMIEYQGRCDEEGRAVGHAPKVLAEYCGMIRDRYRVGIYAPEVITKQLAKDISEASDIKIVRLPHHIVMRSGSSVFCRIANKLRMFANIRHALKEADGSVLWFFNVEFYLFLYLAVFGNMKRRIVVTLFFDGYHTGALARIKQRIFEAGQKKVFRCICAGPSFSYKNMDSVFIPDYACDENVYAQYRKTEKEEKVVCIGTMDGIKQLEELVQAFRGMSYRLVIAGRFYDRERVARLRAMASENTEIRDVYLDDEEYLTLLSGASYAVLPYNSANYAFQTSGVMQEAVFTGTVVLTHRDILDGNRIPGVGYGSYDEINDDLLTDSENNRERNRQILEEYSRLRNETYDRDAIARRIKNSLSA